MSMRPIGELFLVLIFFLVFQGGGFSQHRMQIASAPYESDVLSARPTLYLLGLGAGAYGYRHIGSFSPSCDCDFSNASGIGALGAVEFSVYYPKLGFAIKAMLSYRDYSADFTRKSSRWSVVAGDNPDVLIEYENSSHVILRYLTLTPSIAWYFPFSSVFISGGLEIAMPMENRYDHVERILTEGRTFYNGSTENVLLEETDIPGSGKIGLGISASIGVDIFVADWLYLTPQTGATLPITSVSSSDDSWQVTSAYALIFFKFRL